MRYCGIDVGTRTSSICIIDEQGKVVCQWSCLTSMIAETLAEKLAGYGAGVKCIIEASPLAEHVCRQVEAIGVKIEIVDSRHTKAILQGKKKTDKVDARVLAELCKIGWYRSIHRKSGPDREKRTILNGRAALVKTATMLKNTIRGLLKANGLVLPARCEGAQFVAEVRAKIEKLTPDVQEIFKLLLESWNGAYTAQLKEYKKLGRIARKEPTARRLMTTPGVGPATALAFVSTISSPGRFKSAKQVASYVGLAPRVHQSGSTEFNGRITKQGDKLLRWLLIESAGALLTRVKGSTPLKEWGLRLAERKGLAKAKVAVARRLCLLLFALWKNESDYRAPVGAPEVTEALALAA